MINKLTNNKKGERMKKVNIEKVKVELTLILKDTNPVTANNQIKKWVEDQFKKSGANEYSEIDMCRSFIYDKYESLEDGSTLIADRMTPLKDDLYFDIEKKGKVKKHWKELTVQEWYDYKRGDSNIEVIEERA
tara:strand:- start:34 stop:432 length:399 start_codon:yes stop_codon:yes gene_type:complete